MMGYFRKLFSACLGILLVIAPCITFANYTDVSIGSQLYPALKYLTEKEFVQGYSDGSFGPDKPINRAETLKLILIATGEPITPGDASFSDVPHDVWFAPYVTHAKAKGIISGEPGGTFSPARQVNLAEYLKIVLNAFDIDTSTYTLDQQIADVPNDAWFAPYIKFAVKFNILKPDESGMIYPSTSITRGEAARLLYQTLRQGRGLDPQVLINLTERQLIYALQLIQENDLLTAGFSISTAQNFVNALVLIDDAHPMIILAGDMTNAIRNLLGAHISAQNGLLDDVITSAKNAWNQANAIEQNESESAQQMALSIKMLAQTIADQARQLKQQIQDSI